MAVLSAQRAKRVHTWLSLLPQCVQLVRRTRTLREHLLRRLLVSAMLDMPAPTGDLALLVSRDGTRHWRVALLACCVLLEPLEQKKVSALARETVPRILSLCPGVTTRRTANAMPATPGPTVDRVSCAWQDASRKALGR